MKKDTINIATIGAGSMGRTHAFAVSSLPFFYDLDYRPVLSTVCTRHEESAKDAFERFGYQRYTTDYSSIISDESIDVIDICTPNASHIDYIIPAIKAGKSVLCEKPLVADKTQIELLKKALNENKTNAALGVVFNNRFLPATMRARDIVKEGRLGRIVNFHATYFHDSLYDPKKVSEWRQDVNISGGGVLLDLGSHVIDLMTYIIGEKFEYVLADSTHLENSSVDADYHMNIRTERNTRGTIELSKIINGENDGLKFEIYGEKGSLKFDLMQPNILMFYDAEKPREPYGGESGYTLLECVERYNGEARFPSVKAPIGWLRGHIHSMYNFLECVHKGKVPSPSFEDGLYVDTCITAAYRSEKTQKYEKI